MFILFTTNSICYNLTIHESSHEEKHNKYSRKIHDTVEVEKLLKNNKQILLHKSLTKVHQVSEVDCQAKVDSLNHGDIIKR